MKSEIFVDTYMRIAKTEEGFKVQQEALFKLGYYWGVSYDKIQLAEHHKYLHLITFTENDKSMLWMDVRHTPVADSMVTLSEEVAYSLQPCTNIIQVGGKNYKKDEVYKALEGLKTVTTFQD